jgi:hypothetical protein
MLLKSFTIVLAFVFLTIADSTAQTVYNYNEDVTFEIYKGDIWGQIAGGDGVFFVPGRGYDFYMVYLKFENKSAEKHLLDFDDFFLVKDGSRYEVQVAMPIGLVNRMYLKNRKKLRKNKTLKCKLAIGFPKGEIPDYLSVNGVQIPINPNLFTVK